MDVANKFVVKYRTNEDRVHLIDMIMKLIRMHEISNFHIEEQTSFLQNRVMYNDRTLAKGNNISYDDVEERFIELAN